MGAKGVYGEANSLTSAMRPGRTWEEISMGLRRARSEGLHTTAISSYSILCVEMVQMLVLRHGDSKCSEWPAEASRFLGAGAASLTGDFVTPAASFRQQIALLSFFGRTSYEVAIMSAASIARSAVRGGYGALSRPVFRSQVLTSGRAFSIASRCEYLFCVTTRERSEKTIVFCSIQRADLMLTL